MPTSFLLIALWASLLITFMVAHPSPTSPLSWLLIGSAMFVGVLYMHLSNREKERSQRATHERLKELKELVGDRDTESDATKGRE